MGGQYIEHAYTIKNMACMIDDFFPPVIAMWTVL